jgi:diguanylate cyclase (GGDEF)-like protein
MDRTNVRLMPDDDQLAAERQSDLIAHALRGSPARRPGIGILVWCLGGALLTGAVVLVIVGPTVMSRLAFTTACLVAIAFGLAYGLLVALRSRHAHLQTERAYSSHLEDLSQRLRTMAYRDVLTGLYNHRYFHEQLMHEIDRSVRYGQPLSVLLFDMDNFKAINDTYGHLAGDKFLSLVGQLLADQIRSSDIGARYGGDEFAVILPTTTPDEAQLIANKLEAAVARAVAMTPNDEHVRLGISIGFAACPNDARFAGELLEVADRRLYDVKSSRKVGRVQLRQSA